VKFGGDLILVNKEAIQVLCVSEAPAGGASAGSS
jgi:hypothetical protein